MSVEGTVWATMLFSKALSDYNPRSRTTISIAIYEAGMPRSQEDKGVTHFRVVRESGPLPICVSPPPLFISIFGISWDLDVCSEHQPVRFSGFLSISLQKGHDGGLPCMIQFEESGLGGFV